MKSIIVDHREPNDIIKMLETFDVNVTVEQLSAGDYVVGSDVVIERKSGRDLVQSLYDNRLFEQVKRLGDIYNQVIIIVEDMLLEPHEYKSLFGAISYLMLRQQVSIIPTPDREGTAVLIDRIVSWVQEDHSDPVLSRVAPKRMSLKDRQVYLLQGLSGVGDKTAKLLLDKVGSPFKVFKAIADTNILYTKTGNPKGVDGVFVDIRGIGYTFIDNNQSILLS